MPLLSCCTSMSHDVQSGSGHSAHDMLHENIAHENMAHENMEEALDQQMGHHIANQSMPEDEHMQADQQQCDLHCDYCGAASMALAFSAVFPASPLATVTSSSYNFLPSSGAGDTPFRPPIFA